MTRTADQAIATVAAQSQNGPAFDPGMCKRKSREAYGVPSDGSDDATEAWYRADHRINVHGGEAPRGALLWWTGGSAGHGHVAIADGKGGVWSVDVERAGFWDHVPFAAIASWAPTLRWAGVSLDIDGVQVVPAAVVEKPLVQLPTITDITVALERFAANSGNPVAKGLYLSARRTLGPLVDGRRYRMPVTTRGVIATLEARRSAATKAATKARLTAAINLLRPVR